MTFYHQQSRLKLIDQTLTSMGMAGYNLSESDISFIWRVALGMAEQSEIENWTKQMASKLGRAPAVSLQAWVNVRSAVEQANSAIEQVAKTIMSAS